MRFRVANESRTQRIDFPSPRSHGSPHTLAVGGYEAGMDHIDKCLDRNPVRAIHTVRLASTLRTAAPHRFIKIQQVSSKNTLYIYIGLYLLVVILPQLGRFLILGRRPATPVTKADRSSA